jgi:hypothetical protein
VTVEPGVMLENREALLPVRFLESSGAPYRFRLAELLVEVDGVPVRNPGLVSFGRGGEPFALAVLLDPAAFREADVPAWAAELATFAQGSDDQEVPSLLGLGEGLRVLSGRGRTPPPVDRVADLLRSDERGRLWDGTLAALEGLSGPGLPVRRVLITCVEAADRARVAVFAVMPRPPAEDTEAGAARLRVLTERTGGSLVVGGQEGGVDGLRSVLAQIRGTRGVRIRGLEGTPPFPVTVRPGVALANTSTGWIRSRRAVVAAGGEPFPWVPFVVGLATLLVAALLLGHRFLPVGRLVTVSGAPPGTTPVTRSGLTLGGAVGNRLVLPDPRISRHHAVIRMERGKVLLVDTRSANGTKVNGRRVSTAPLKDGDRILLADAVELVYESGFRFGPGPDHS